MMSKITFEAAKKLEKIGYTGFNLLGCYYMNNKPVMVTVREKLSVPNDFLQAPELHEVQDWLRETKRLEVNSFWCYNDSCWLGYFCPMDLPSLESVTNDEFSETYEDALSLAINEALDYLSEHS